MVPGAAVWLAVAVSGTVWLVALVLSRGALVGPRRVVRWLVGSWLPRVAVLAAWAAAGWHVFCQRP
jgi:hypothetical protein